MNSKDRAGGGFRFALAYICHALCSSIRQYVSHVRVTTSEKIVQVYLIWGFRWNLSLLQVVFLSSFQS